MTFKVSLETLLQKEIIVMFSSKGQKVLRTDQRRQKAFVSNKLKISNTQKLSKPFNLEVTLNRFQELKYKLLKTLIQMIKSLKIKNTLYAKVDFQGSTMKFRVHFSTETVADWQCSLFNLNAL